MSFTPRIVFVTAPNWEEARALAAGILKKHLAACVNLVPGLESHYWWQGRLEKSDEILLIVKSSAEQFEDLAQHIRSHHSYDCPEIVALASREISPEYRAWWEKESSPQEA